MKSRHLLRPAILTGILLLVPLVMTIVDRDKPYGEGWHWKPGSFVVFGALIFGAGWLYESIAGKLPGAKHRAALGGAIVIAVLAIWSELAVGAVSKGARLLLG